MYGDFDPAIQHLAITPFFGWMGSMVRTKRRVVLGWVSSLETMEKIPFTPYASPSETPPAMQLPTPKLALIREKRALLFPDNPLACPVLLSGSESELKMAAGSN